MKPVTVFVIKSLLFCLDVMLNEINKGKNPSHLKLLLVESPGAF